MRSEGARATGNRDGPCRVVLDESWNVGQDRPRGELGWTSGRGGRCDGGDGTEASVSADREHLEGWGRGGRWGTGSCRERGTGLSLCRCWWKNHGRILSSKKT